VTGDTASAGDMVARPGVADPAAEAVISAGHRRAASAAPLPPADVGAAPTALVKSADRVLQNFELMATRGPQTFSQVVAALGLPASSTHNLLKTLVRRRYLLLDPEDRRYRLGLRLWEVAQAYAANDQLPRLAQPIMDRVVALTGETVQLARLDGVENVYLAISESPQPMKLVSAVGKRLYAHATGLGKVLLAGLTDEEVRRRFGRIELPRFTPNTIVQLEVLLRVLADVRADGYAIDCEEYVIGCRCIAMPVRDAQGDVIAAMSVSVPTPRFSDALERAIRAALGDAVAELSARIGHVPPGVRERAESAPAAGSPAAR
jgi:DNA-binding IclR family transcriptional regulator